MKNGNYEKLASDEVIRKTTASLKKNGINTYIASNAEKTRELVRSLIKDGSEVMTATSKTLESLGLQEEINDSGKYNSVKSQLKKLDRSKDNLIMQKIGAAPEYVIGSVHAVTQDGKIIVASGSGSQLPSYSYGASKVVWVVSTKKIVKNIDEGLNRIYQHILPKEDKRVKDVYGPDASSSPRKILVFNSESNTERLHLIFVRKNLGF